MSKKICSRKLVVHSRNDGTVDFEIDGVVYKNCVPIKLKTKLEPAATVETITLKYGAKKRG